MFEELHLGGETFTKTKNDLIYRNDVMKISMEDLNARLSELQKILDEGAEPPKVRETILNLITN